MLCILAQHVQGDCGVATLHVQPMNVAMTARVPMIPILKNRHGPLPKTKHGNKYILTINFVIMPQGTNHTLTEYRGEVLTDQGANFMSALLDIYHALPADLADMYNIPKLKKFIRRTGTSIYLLQENTEFKLLYGDQIRGLQDVLMSE